MVPPLGVVILTGVAPGVSRSTTSVSASCRMVVRLAVIMQVLCCVCGDVRFNTACEYQEIVLHLRISGGRCPPLREPVSSPGSEVCGRCGLRRDGCGVRQQVEGTRGGAHGAGRDSQVT